MNCRYLLGCFLALGVALSVGVSAAVAAEPSTASTSSSKNSSASKAPAGELVELFAAMEKGEIEVKLILKDSTTGIVTIKNKTDKPLTIQLPAAFAGVPVLAQLGGGFGGGGMGGGGQGGQGGGQQGVGGGMGGGGMGGGGMGGGGGGMGGGGLFNVGPDKVGKLTIVAVCLEHGKKDPNPRVPYELRPIESFAKKGEVVELVKMLAKGQIDQHSAQAAAWHLNNDMSWNELAHKIGKKHLDGSTEPYFTAVQLEIGLRASREAAQRAEEVAKKNPSKEVKSLSSK